MLENGKTMQNKTFSVSNSEAFILGQLINLGLRETFGLELVESSNGQLKKGSIYVLLRRMEDKGYVTSRKEKQRPNFRGLPRRMYKITGCGELAFKNELDRINQLMQFGRVNGAHFA